MELYQSRRGFVPPIPNIAANTRHMMHSFILFIFILLSPFLLYTMPSIGYIAFPYTYVNLIDVCKKAQTL